METQTANCHISFRGKQEFKLESNAPTLNWFVIDIDNWIYPLLWSSLNSKFDSKFCVQISFKNTVLVCKGNFALVCNKDIKFVIKNRSRSLKWCEGIFLCSYERGAIDLLFPIPVQTDLVHLYNEYPVSFPGIKRPGRGVDHFHLAPMHKALPLLLFCAFAACYGRPLPLTIIVNAKVSKNGVCSQCMSHWHSLFFFWNIRRSTMFRKPVLFPSSGWWNP